MFVVSQVRLLGTDVGEDVVVVTTVDVVDEVGVVVDVVGVVEVVVVVDDEDVREL